MIHLLTHTIHIYLQNTLKIHSSQMYQVFLSNSIKWKQLRTRRRVKIIKPVGIIYTYVTPAPSKSAKSRSLS